MSKSSVAVLGEQRRQRAVFPSHQTGLTHRSNLVAIASALLMTCMSWSSHAEVNQSAIPSMVHKEGRHALMVDGAPFLMLGAQANNSSNYPASLPKVWQAIDQ